MSRFRHVLCAALIMGVATIGTAGVATAQSTPTTPGPSVQQHEPRCDKAKDRLARLEARRVRSEQVIDRLHAAIKAAQDHHRDDLAKRLQARLDRVQVRHDHIVDLINKIHARCG